jgi:pantothenate kinase
MTPAGFAEHVAALAAGRARFLVGIAGAPGAGKSTLAAATAMALGPDAVVLPMDGFHLPQARLVELGRRDRMGAPDTFDVDGFVATLEALRSPAPVRAPLFDRTIEEPVPDALEVAAGIRIVIVEGNYLLHDRDGWERVAPLLDLTAYVDEDDELRRERLIARHIAFGKSPDAARAWVLGPDEANARLIAATAGRADIRVTSD